MNQEHFWQIIEKNHDSNNDVMANNLHKALLLLDSREIAQFIEIYSTYAENAESPATYVACKLINGSASDDTQLYFNMWLVAQGKDVYFGTLNDPDYLAELDLQTPVEFEMALAPAFKILSDRNEMDSLGEHFLDDEDLEDILDEIPEAEWPEGEEDLIDAMDEFAPELYAKYAGDDLS